MNSFFKDSFDNIREYLDSVTIDDSWVSREILIQTYDDLSANLDKHYEQASQELSYIFLEEFILAEQTQKTLELVQMWDNNSNTSSITAIIIYSLERLGFTKNEEEYIKPLLMASVLSEVSNDLPYHDNLHFRKVVLHMVRMIVAHNKIFLGTSNHLNNQQITQLIISAAIHDLAHKGRGNIVDRHYNMAQLEKRSFELSSSYLNPIGLSKNLLEDMRIMLIATDTSPFGDPISPANQARAAYEYHFGSDETADNLELYDDLKILEDRADLCLMCIMLHEADILNSAGVGYQITIKESIAVSIEIGMGEATPEYTLLFLEKICNSEMLSDSAQYIASDNMRVILLKVMNDYKNGNNPYI